MSSSITKLNELLSSKWILTNKLNQNKVLDVSSQRVVINYKRMLIYKNEYYHLVHDLLP